MGCGRTHREGHVHVGGKVIIETFLDRSFSALIAWPTSSPLIQAVDKVAAKPRAVTVGSSPPAIFPWYLTWFIASVQRVAQAIKSSVLDG